MSNLAEIRHRFVPILKVTVEQYRGRVPTGYPNLVDDLDAGTLGLEIDPNFAVYITQDEEGQFVEMYKRDPRLDARATAGRQKYGGSPVVDRRPIEGDLTDQELRNLVAELKVAFNNQPGLIYITDD
jgi:hypothetical protein